jgi:uncharacterized membrane protein
MADHATRSKPARRIEFIDLVRGWAVIVMIETHIMNATLRPEILAGAVFPILNFINGLVAPSFLFASGLAYAVTTRRKLNDYLAFGPTLFKQFGRLLLILAIGYTMHIPKFNYHHLVYVAGERAWELFWQVDILHCIAISLIVLQIMLLLLRNERRLYRATLSLTCFVALLTPFIWMINFVNYLPFSVGAYFNGLHDSLFPLFPWAAFLFSGALTGYEYLKGKDRETSDGDGVKRAMTKLAWYGTGAIIVSFLIEPAAAAFYPVYDYWRISPSFFLLRLGIVVLFTCGMYLYERVHGVSARSVVTLIGRESLFVYVAHLLLIFGRLGRFNFAEAINRSFGYAEALAATAGLMLLMYVLALVWNRIKKGPPRARVVVELSFLCVLVGIFFLGPAE